MQHKSVVDWIMKHLRLYDTMSRQHKVLAPCKSGPFRFYCCGPTVYGPAHIGNFRSFILQDVLRRVLELTGLDLMHVRNITDVDDKTIRGSIEAGASLSDFTQAWTDRFHADCDALKLLRPHVEPRATQHIEGQIQLIEALIKSGHAYVTDDQCVYFRVSAFKDYGKLSHIDRAALQQQDETSAGERNLADEYDREQLADFALWKAHKPADGPVYWESPWGRGRPGWHLECSAMSTEYLGNDIDLHAGGIDLCFPHHENEIAQSEAATHETFCHHWFHTAHLRVEDAKMSKSLGNLYTLEDIEKKGFEANVLRYLLVSGHYKQPLNFTLDGMRAAKSALARLQSFYAHVKGDRSASIAYSDGKPREFDRETWGPFEGAFDALCEDLNTPKCLGSLFESINQCFIDKMSESEKAAAQLGLEKIAYALGLSLESATVVIPNEIQALAQDRWEAKCGRNFQKADALRDLLQQKGWTVLDQKEGYEIRPL